MRKLLSYCALVAFFAVLLYSCKKGDDAVTPDPAPDTTTGTETGGELVFPKKEMRAVWITTVWELDWPQGKYDVAAQKQLYIDFLEKFQALNINAVFFQVKGMGDAFYASSYEPWSEAITGTRGQDPGYDVLRFLIEEAHKRNIEFHAWMNPYRIDTRAGSGTPFAALHPSVNPDWVLNLDKIQIYNPALPEVRQRLVDIVKELITKYEVDGIHFDDYFYPAGETIPDEEEYAQYGKPYSSVADFRRANVNEAIEAVHDVIVATKPEVVFSVSPAPNEDYNYNTLFADVVKWCKSGWVDVIIPQLYHEIGNPYNDFKTNLNYWSHYHYKAALMVGHGYYRFGDPDAPAAFQSTAELQRQFDLVRKNDKVVGQALYSARFIPLNKIGVTDKLAALYSDPAVIPFLGREVAAPPVKAKNVSIQGAYLNWDSQSGTRSVVYYFADKKQPGKVLAITDQRSFPVSEAGYYCVTTLNQDNAESEPSALVQWK